ncbi:CheB methylesterase domain-containing protein [Sulfurospirillum arcachonense]|uniref:CheB methylesterase domain-containing protein n=1 Tax=Sulfurospirillum arcachonense TaxID=57666 RepID=UPI0004686CB3|nr:CheB methylesterase domain-containing protein [Sulfurospirillum arcachonense]
MKEKLILIGASTGGPGHLKKILVSLNSYFSIPIVIAQHMNPVFIPSFVKQFDNELPFDFFLADDRHNIEASTIHICAKHCALYKRGYELKLENSLDVASLYNPSVDHMFHSAVKLVKDYDILAILLTGIGHDGAEGLSQLQKAGALCIAESEESAIVYGMPKKAIELNANIKMMNLDNIINSIKKFGGV